MKLNKKNIDYLATLAKLSFSDEEEEPIEKELNQFFLMAQCVVEVAKTPKLLHVSSQEVGNLREDRSVTLKQTVQEAMQQLAPQVKEGFYTVPKVIE
jgi:aspartyl/glutamyl-tRNA(asn/gln) amidotransferase, C subunit